MRYFFYGKILLFGEYSIIAGSEALVVPYRKVSALLDFIDNAPPERKKPANRSNKTIALLAQYINQLVQNGQLGFIFHLDSMIRDINQGLYLHSTIPEKYGLGSSAALCASLYARYAGGPVAPAELSEKNAYISTRNHLSKIESFFHMQSSGIDPLCSYTNQILHITYEGMIDVRPELNILRRNTSIFLIDSNMENETGSLVEIFRQKLKNEKFESGFTGHYIPLINRITERMISDYDLIYNDIALVSEYQLTHFREMIPASLLSLWEYGLETSSYACKLCGSGGGGYILGFTQYFEKVNTDILKRFNRKVLELEL